jgi:hypothetical protein
VLCCAASMLLRYCCFVLPHGFVYGMLLALHLRSLCSYGCSCSKCGFSHTEGAAVSCKAKSLFGLLLDIPSCLAQKVTPLMQPPQSTSHEPGDPAGDCIGCSVCREAWWLLLLL